MTLVWVTRESGIDAQDTQWRFYAFQSLTAGAS